MSDQRMTPSTELDLDALEAKARAATPGEWIARPHGRLIGGPLRHYVNGSAQAQIAAFSITHHEQAPDDEPERQQANTDFVAAFSPATALRLIELARRSAPLACDSDAQLRDEVRQIIQSLGTKGWADTLPTDPDAARLELAIRRLITTPMPACDSDAPFRERFKAAYEILSVAHLNGPFWNQGMEELLSAVDAEITRRAALAQQPSEGGGQPLVRWSKEAEMTESWLATEAAREGGGQPVASIGDDAAFLSLLAATVLASTDRLPVYAAAKTALIAHIDGYVRARLAATTEGGKPVAWPRGFSVNRVEGHGWYIDPPNGSRWVAHDGTPASDFIAALAAPALDEAKAADEVAKDAARWRWMREHWFCFGGVVHSRTTTLGMNLHRVGVAGDKETLDVAVDAAIADDRAAAQPDSEVKHG